MPSGLRRAGFGMLGQDLSGSRAVREHHHRRRDREAQSLDAGRATHDRGLVMSAGPGGSPGPRQGLILRTMHRKIYKMCLIFGVTDSSHPYR
jgi:hypothetical protein